MVGLLLLFKTIEHGVWVPAFAGTTQIEGSVFGESYALCADLTITILSSWPACRFRLSRRMPISSRTNS
jgi:hypothetical protein